MSIEYLEQDKLLFQGTLFFPNVENAFGTPVVHVLFFIFEGLILFAKLQQKHKRIAAALQS